MTASLTLIHFITISKNMEQESLDWIRVVWIFCAYFRTLVPKLCSAPWQATRHPEVWLLVQS